MALFYKQKIVTITTERQKYVEFHLKKNKKRHHVLRMSKRKKNVIRLKGPELSLLFWFFFSEIKKIIMGRT